MSHNIQAGVIYQYLQLKSPLFLVRSLSMLLHMCHVAELVFSSVASVMGLVVHADKGVALYFYIFL